ncbi:hypothetical protein Q4503_06565 [Colwellia sp. 6_MG-2023]|uniref:hypothetical protein n=1 Tax=Colwellia sp. 6_MG-2023 TaxID=3062676 RepID=UPI0026E3BBD3|nr:hypothetical protein [Colwellia sp. 6_MG-2023]MDO6487356.1 hypothetical protein [Colwellia sp. 6_MG-2023]
MGNSGLISSSLSQKKWIVELIVIAVMIGLGVGIISSSFVTFITLPVFNIIVIALLLILIGFLVLCKSIVATLSFNEKIRAQFLLDENNSIISIRKYKFATELARTLKAVFQESKALEKIWNEQHVKSKIGAEVSRDESSNDNQPPKKDIEYYAVCKVEEVEGEPKAKHEKQGGLLKEAIEFVILEELSLHLSSYFNDYQEDDEIRELQRKDVPEFLLENRVFATLTKPIEDRDIFIDAFPDPEKRPEGEICMLYGSNGAMYSKFDLLLPKGTKITKNGNGGFKLENSRLVLEIEVIFEGFSASFSNEFVKFYVGKNPRSTKGKLIYVNISGHVKPLSLLKSSGWVYYKWLDSFINRMKNNLSFEHFLDNVHWEYVSCNLYSQRHKKPNVQNIKDTKSELKLNKALKAEK